MLEKIQDYRNLSDRDLSQVSGGNTIGIDNDTWKHVRDFLWGFKNGLEGRSRHHRSWRDRD